MFFFYHWYRRFCGSLIFVEKSSVRVSTDGDRFVFVTFFHASFDIKRYHFALLMLNFVIVVCGSEFFPLMFTVIT